MKRAPIESGAFFCLDTANRVGEVARKREKSRKIKAFLGKRFDYWIGVCYNNCEELLLFLRYEYMASLEPKSRQIRFSKPPLGEQ